MATTEYNDDFLRRWGEYGRGVTIASTTLNPMGGLADDIIMLWNLFGELEKKVRDGCQP